jgi:hypothetical protein
MPWSGRAPPFSALVVMSSNHSDQEYTLDDLLRLLEDKIFIIFLSLVTLCLVICSVLYR